MFWTAGVVTPCGLVSEHHRFGGTCHLGFTDEPCRLKQDLLRNLSIFNLLKPTGHVMHQQFNIQQLYALPTLYLCVLYLSQNKQLIVPLTALTDWFL
jgi:hypothetical protein